MDAVYQILTWTLSGTSLLGLVGSIAYYKQTKRTKEAEAQQKEAEAEVRKIDVEKGKVEARKLEIDLLTAQLERMERACDQKDNRLSDLNDVIDKHIDRRRELSDKLYKSEQEVNRVQNLLNDAKDEIIRLTEKSDRLEAVKCIRNDCQDPRGPKPPRKRVATDNEKTASDINTCPD